MSFQTDVRLSREKQITSLRVFNNNVTEVLAGKEYSIRVDASNLNLTITIRLPEKFPAEKPLLEISPAVLHPWIDSVGKVDSPGLRNFSAHSDLGMVVLALRSELEKCSLQLRNPGTGGVASPPPNYAPSPAAVMSPPAPNIDPIRSKLTEMSVEELKSVLNDEDHFDKFLMELETDYQPLESLLSSIEEQRAELKAKAEENQELQTQIEASRNQIICKYEEFHTKKSELQSTVDRLRELEQRVNPNILADRLLRLSVANEEESDEVADNFLHKNIQIEEFMKQYIDRRGEGYLRKTKADKIKLQKR